MTLELTPDQAEKLDLARSIGTLSLVLRNQIDPNPVNTGGATKTSLLDLKLVATAAAPRPAYRPLAQRPQQVPRPQPHTAHIEIIKGLDRSTQQF